MLPELRRSRGTIIVEHDLKTEKPERCDGHRRARSAEILSEPDGLYEVIDGRFVEKPMGAYEVLVGRIGL